MRAERGWADCAGGQHPPPHLATCPPPAPPSLSPALSPTMQEIIELSAVIVQTSTLTVLPATFQRYVRPDQHPVLTPFCTQLTGITQEMCAGAAAAASCDAAAFAWGVPTQCWCWSADAST